MAITTREIHLQSRPADVPGPENFRLVSRELPPIASGQLLVRNTWMSVDPYMRGRMVDRESYIAPFRIGSALEGGAVGVVEQSADRRFKAGDVVTHFAGWRDYALIDAGSATKIDAHTLPAQNYLGALGITGLTAYVGLFRIGELRPGNTVFVSAAAGAVGYIACQIARLAGCRVVGSVGSDDKARWLRNELGVDEVINYKTTRNLTQALTQACPNGIDVYFDNVGGAHLEAALTVANSFARFVLCGMIEQYNSQTPPLGPSNLMSAVLKSVKLQGFIITDHLGLFPEFTRVMTEWISQGRVKSRESVFEGLENAPAAFIGLFKGDNFGKMLVKLGERQARAAPAATDDVG